MATTVAHASLIRYDSAGNQLVINLKNTGDDVSISRSSNGNLPSGATTVQGLANSLGDLAFRSSLGKGDVGLGNVDNTADSSKSVKYATSAGSANAVAWGNVFDKPSVPESGDFSADTLEDLLKEVQGKSPRMGSTNLRKDTRVYNSWYNFIYIPHRTGIGGDNMEYGTLVLFPMVFNGESAIIRAGKDGSVQSIYTLYSSRNISEASVNHANSATSASKLVHDAIQCGDNKNTTGYRLIATVNLDGWSNYRAVLLVRSRHEGAGILSIGIGCNNATVSYDNAYAEIKYFGIVNSANVINPSAYKIYMSSDGKTAYLFELYQDYSPLYYVTLSSDFGINANGTWVTSISTATYGKLKATTEINRASSVDWSGVQNKPSTYPSEDNLVVSKTTPNKACLWAKID